MTIVPAAWAKTHGLPIPIDPIPRLEVRQFPGQPVRDGFLRAQVVQRDGLEYFFPCYFVGDPDGPSGAPHAPSTKPRTLLGVTGVVDKIHISWDGTPVPAA